MIKNIATVLATVSLGLVTLAACGGGDDDKAAGKETSPAAGTGASTPPGTTPAPGGVPSPGLSSPPANRPAPGGAAVAGSQVIMIDPDGKKYTRKDMVQLAAGMGAAMGKKLPANFCARSYKEGVKGGGKFPAGRQAFLDACEEGMRLAG